MVRQTDRHAFFIVTEAVPAKSNSAMRLRQAQMKGVTFHFPAARGQCEATVRVMLGFVSDHAQVSEYLFTCFYDHEYLCMVFLLD